MAAKFFILLAIFVNRLSAQSTNTTTTTTVMPNGDSSMNGMGGMSTMAVGATATTPFGSPAAAPTQNSGPVTGTISRQLDVCSQNCLSQNVRNPSLYGKFFQLLSQTEYTTVCNEINGIQSCIASCSPNCLTATLPMYTQSCSVGYQNFTNLYDCMNAMASTYNNIYSQCQQQCNSNSNSVATRGRRQSGGGGGAGGVPSANNNLFCITECGMNQELPMIQNQCTQFVMNLSKFLSQTYDNLASNSPQCLNTNFS